MDKLLIVCYQCVWSPHAVDVVSDCTLQEGGSVDGPVAAEADEQSQVAKVRPIISVWSSVLSIEIIILIKLCLYVDKNIWC